MVNFGVYLPTFSDHVYSKDLYELNLRTALLAEDLGYNSLWAPDHLQGFTSIVKVGREVHLLECMTLLSSLASLTKKLLIGPSVACALFRNPALLAKMAATLDVISGGRLVLGIGAGWRREEFIGYGYGWESFDSRFSKTKEAIEIVKRLWMEPKVSFKGRYYKMVDGELYPKPIQKPRPPIWLGGVGPKILRLLSEVDGWLAPPLNIEDFKGRLEGFKDKPFYKALELYTCIDLEEDKALVRCREAVENWFGKPLEYVAKYEAKVPLPSGITVRYGATVGNPDRCIKDLEAYIKAGVQHFILHFMPLEETPNQMKLYAEKVIPYIKQNFAP